MFPKMNSIIDFSRSQQIGPGTSYCGAQVETEETKFLQINDTVQKSFRLFLETNEGHFCTVRTWRK